MAPTPSRAALDARARKIDMRIGDYEPGCPTDHGSRTFRHYIMANSGPLNATGYSALAEVAEALEAAEASARDMADAETEIAAENAQKAAVTLPILKPKLAAAQGALLSGDSLDCCPDSDAYARALAVEEARGSLEEAECLIERGK